MDFTIPHVPRRPYDLMFWEADIRRAINAGGAQSSPLTLHSPEGVALLSLDLDASAGRISLATPADAPYTWHAGPTLGRFPGAISACAALAGALALLPYKLPGFEARTTSADVVFMRGGQDYAHLVLHPGASLGEAGWRGTINGKPWTPLLTSAEALVKALRQRQKTNDPFYVFADQGGLFYAGEQEEGLVYLPSIPKARKFKRLGDARGHASWLGGVGQLPRPTEPGWFDAYKDDPLVLRPVRANPSPLPQSTDLVMVDRTTKARTVIETGAQREVRIARRIMIQRRVIARYGHGSAAALDAALDAGREDLDTLVLVYDATGAANIRAILKSMGLAKASIARKATYSSYPPTPLTTWSLAVPARVAAEITQNLPGPIAVLPFSEIFKQ